MPYLSLEEVLEIKNDMKRLLCECCNLHEAFSVASTCIPYSAAYCSECAHNACNPMWVGFAQMDMTGGHEGLADWFLDGETVFDPLNRRYVTMREYFKYYIPQVPNYEEFYNDPTAIPGN